MKAIPVDQLLTKPINLFQNQWLLLCAGDAENYNMMTIAWGSIGCMWGRPFVQVVVRPQRYTYEFMEKYSEFTLSAFGEAHRRDLQTLGSLSGRDGDKLAQTQLTTRPGLKVACPAFEQAELIFECVQIYYDDFDPNRFLDPDIEGTYANQDYHRIYFGEILAAYA